VLATRPECDDKDDEHREPNYTLKSHERSVSTKRDLRRESGRVRDNHTKEKLTTQVFVDIPASVLWPPKTEFKIQTPTCQRG
jgi:hypothetical protein